MSMPTIPEEPHRPNREQVVNDLLKSVAMEENALAHLMNTEAEKLRSLMGASATLPVVERSNLLCRHAAQTIQLMDMIIMKEWLLLRKIDHTLEYSCATDPSSTDPQVRVASSALADPAQVTALADPADPAFPISQVLPVDPATLATSRSDPSDWGDPANPAAPEDWGEDWGERTDWGRGGEDWGRPGAGPIIGFGPHIGGEHYYDHDEIEAEDEEE